MASLLSLSAMTAVSAAFLRKVAFVTFGDVLALVTFGDVLALVH
jgi:hypothetical protein